MASAPTLQHLVVRPRLFEGALATALARYAGAGNPSPGTRRTGSLAACRESGAMTRRGRYAAEWASRAGTELRGTRHPAHRVP